jgi:hypothetical protein
MPADQPTSHAPDDDADFLSRRAAGVWLQRRFSFGSEKVLAKLAWAGGGPISYRMGAKVLYKPEDLRIWAMAQVSPPVTSASDNKRRRAALAASSSTEAHVGA